MLSRVADSIYWMNRYIERAENVARFIDVNLHLNLDLPAGSAEQWSPLVSITGDDEAFAKRHAVATRENVIEFLTFDAENPNSIRSCLRAARENGRSVREIISSEMWEQVNRFYLMVNSSAALERAIDSPSEFYNDIKMASHLYGGLAFTTMSHNEAWHFGRLARLMERADKASRILDVKYFILLPSVSDVGTPFDTIQWSAVLRSASAFEMYRKRFGRIAPRRVVEFLLLDAEFPRAVRYCLDKAEASLHVISGTPVGRYRYVPEQRLGQLCSELSFAAIDPIMECGLHEFVDDLQVKLNLVGEGIRETFFAQRPVATEVTDGYSRSAQSQH
ncbi:MAG: alpha-E domain-containing protein [Verrucomicrobiota bacterium]